MNPSAVTVVIAEDVQLSGLNDLFLADLLFPSGDIVEDEFGNVGVVAYYDKNRGRQPLFSRFRVLFPHPVVFFIIPIKTMKSPLKLRGQLRFAGKGFSPPTFLGQVIPDSQP